MNVTRDLTNPLERAIGVLNKFGQSAKSVSQSLSQTKAAMEVGRRELDKVALSARNLPLAAMWKSIPQEVYNARKAVLAYNDEMNRAATIARILELRLSLSYKTPLVAVQNLCEETKRLSNAMNNAFAGIKQFMTSTGVSISDTRTTLLEFNRALFDVERMSNIVGRSGVFSQKTWDDFRKNTNLSEMDAKKLYASYLSLNKGLGMTSEQYSKFAASITKSFGGGADVFAGFQNNLLAIQAVLPDIYEQLEAMRESIAKGEEPVAFKSLMAFVENRFGTRYMQEMAQFVQGMTEAEIAQKRYENSQAKLQQATTDTATHIAKNMEPALTNINNLMASATKGIDGMTQSMETLPKGIAYFNQIALAVTGLNQGIGAARWLKNLAGFGSVAAGAAGAAETAAKTAARTAAEVGTGGLAGAAGKKVVEMGAGGLVGGTVGKTGASWLSKLPKAGRVGMISAGIAGAAMGGYYLYDKFFKKKPEEKAIEPTPVPDSEARRKSQADVRDVSYAAGELTGIATRSGEAKKWLDATRGIADKLKEIGAIGAGITSATESSAKAARINYEYSKRGYDIAKNQYAEAEETLRLAIKSGDAKKIEMARQDVVFRGVIRTNAELEKTLALQNSIAESIRKTTLEYEASADFIGKQISLMEVEADYVEKLALGMAPSYEMRKKIWQATVEERQELEKSAVALAKNVSVEQIMGKTLDQIGVSREDQARIGQADMAAYRRAVDAVKGTFAGDDQKEALQVLAQMYGKIRDTQKEIYQLKIKELDQTMKIREGYMDVINEMTTGNDLVSRLLPNMERGAMSILDISRQMKGADFGGAMRVGFASQTGFGFRAGAGLAPRYTPEGLKGSFSNPVLNKYMATTDKDYGVNDPRAAWFAGVDAGRSNLGEVGMAGFTGAMNPYPGGKMNIPNPFTQAVPPSQSPDGSIGVNKIKADGVSTPKIVAGGIEVTGGNQGARSVGPMISPAHARFYGGLLRSFQEGGNMSLVDLTSRGGRIGGAGAAGRDDSIASIVRGSGRENVLVGGGEFFIPNKFIKDKETLKVLEMINGLGSGGASNLPNENAMRDAFGKSTGFKISDGFIMNRRSMKISGVRESLEDLISGNKNPFGKFLSFDWKSIRGFRQGGETVTVSTYNHGRIVPEHMTLSDAVKSGYSGADERSRKLMSEYASETIAKKLKSESLSRGAANILGGSVGYYGKEKYSEAESQDPYIDLYGGEKKGSRFGIVRAGDVDTREIWGNKNLRYLSNLAQVAFVLRDIAGGKVPFSGGSKSAASSIGSVFGFAAGAGASYASDKAIGKLFGGTFDSPSASVDELTKGMPKRLSLGLQQILRKTKYDEETNKRYKSAFLEIASGLSLAATGNLTGLGFAASGAAKSIGTLVESKSIKKAVSRNDMIDLEMSRMEDLKDSSKKRVQKEVDDFIRSEADSHELSRTSDGELIRVSKDQKTRDMLLKHYVESKYPNVGKEQQDKIIESIKTGQSKTGYMSDSKLNENRTFFNILKGDKISDYLVKGLMEKRSVYSLGYSYLKEEGKKRDAQRRKIAESKKDEDIQSFLDELKAFNIDDYYGSNEVRDKISNSVPTNLPQDERSRIIIRGLKDYYSKDKLTSKVYSAINSAVKFSGKPAYEFYIKLLQILSEDNCLDFGAIMESINKRIQKKDEESAISKDFGTLRTMSPSKLAVDKTFSQMRESTPDTISDDELREKAAELVLENNKKYVEETAYRMYREMQDAALSNKMDIYNYKKTVYENYTKGYYGQYHNLDEQFAERARKEDFLNAAQSGDAIEAGRIAMGGKSQFDTKIDVYTKKREEFNRIKAAMQAEAEEKVAKANWLKEKDRIREELDVAINDEWMKRMSGMFGGLSEEEVKRREDFPTLSPERHKVIDQLAVWSQDIQSMNKRVGPNKTGSAVMQTGPGGTYLASGYGWMTTNYKSKNDAIQIIASEKNIAMNQPQYGNMNAEQKRNLMTSAENRAKRRLKSRASGGSLDMSHGGVVPGAPAAGRDNMFGLMDSGERILIGSGEGIIPKNSLKTKRELDFANALNENGESVLDAIRLGKRGFADGGNADLTYRNAYKDAASKGNELRIGKGGFVIREKSMPKKPENIRLFNDIVKFGFNLGGRIKGFDSGGANLDTSGLTPAQIKRFNLLRSSGTLDILQLIDWLGQVQRKNSMERRPFSFGGLSVFASGGEFISYDETGAMLVDGVKAKGSQGFITSVNGVDYISGIRATDYHTFIDRLVSQNQSLPPTAKDPDINRRIQNMRFKLAIYSQVRSRKREEMLEVIKARDEEKEKSNNEFVNRLTGKYAAYSSPSNSNWKASQGEVDAYYQQLKYDQSLGKRKNETLPPGYSFGGNIGAIPPSQGIFGNEEIRNIRQIVHRDGNASFQDLMSKNYQKVQQIKQQIIQARKSTEYQAPEAKGTNMKFLDPAITRPEILPGGSKYVEDPRYRSQVEDPRMRWAVEPNDPRRDFGQTWRQSGALGVMSEGGSLQGAIQRAFQEGGGIRAPSGIQIGASSQQSYSSHGQPSTQTKASLYLTGGINVDRLYLGGSIIGQRMRSDNSDFWKKLELQAIG